MILTFILQQKIITYEIYIPDELLDDFIKDYNGFSNVRDMESSEIIHKSKNKTDLELYITVKKYNL